MDPDLAKAARVLEQGGIVAFPTDTVWGILVRPDDPEAVAKVYRLKGRRRDQPLQLLLADAELARRLLPQGYDDPRFVAFTQRFWPGPLTLIVPAGHPFPAIGATRTLGLRVPDHPALRSLLRKLGGLLAATSLNPSGQPPVRTEDEARRFAVDMVVPGPPPPGRASSVVDLTTGRILRAEALPAKVLIPLLEAP